MICSIDVCNEWIPLKDKFINSGGSLIVIGANDTGKSIFSRWLALEALNAGKFPAIIDADTGQSDIGPPACVGLKLLKEKFDLFSHIDADFIYFVGATSPVRYTANGIAGVAIMKDLALNAGASHIILNTTGWVEGKAAITYKQAKIEVFKPRYIVAFDKDNELCPLIEPYRKIITPSVFSLPISSAVKPRRQDDRRKKREEIFKDYFKESKTFNLSLKNIGITGAAFPVLADEVTGQIAALYDRYNRCRALGFIKSYDTISEDFEIKAPVEKPVDIVKIRFEGFHLSFDI